MLFCGGGIPGDVCWVSFEEIWDEDTVFFWAGVGEDVGALEGLGEEAEDILGFVVSVCIE